MKHMILNALLEKYEKSRVYQSQTEQQRRILLKPKDFKKINFEDYEKKTAFFEALEELKIEGVIDYEWVLYEKGNLVSKIWLIQNLECVKRAYQIIGKIPTYVEHYDTMEIIKSTKFNYYSWMETLRQELIKTFEQTGKFGQLLTSDQDLNHKIIKCLIELERLSGEPIHERIFSVLVLGDSKAFQKLIKPKLLTWMKRYIDDFNDTDPMSYVGIMTNPELLFFCGPLIIYFNEGIYDASFFTNGATVLSHYVDEIIRLDMHTVKKVIFIENRTTYEVALRHRSEDMLLVYHGGFAGKLKHGFFKKIFDCSQDTVFYHWSDMDLGGVRIFKALKNTIPVLEPIFMDRKTLEDYYDSSKPMTSAYRDKVKNAMEKEEDPQIKEMLKVCYDMGVRLEQEAIKSLHELGC